MQPGELQPPRPAGQTVVGQVDDAEPVAARPGQPAEIGLRRRERFKVHEHRQVDVRIEANDIESPKVRISFHHVAAADRFCIGNHSSELERLRIDHRPGDIVAHDLARVADVAEAVAVVVGLAHVAIVRTVVDPVNGSVDVTVAPVEHPLGVRDLDPVSCAGGHRDVHHLGPCFGHDVPHPVAHGDRRDQLVDVGPNDRSDNVDIGLHAKRSVVAHRRDRDQGLVDGSILHDLVRHGLTPDVGDEQDLGGPHRHRIIGGEAHRCGNEGLGTHLAVDQKRERCHTNRRLRLRWPAGANPRSAERASWHIATPHHSQISIVEIDPHRERVRHLGRPLDHHYELARVGAFVALERDLDQHIGVRRKRGLLCLDGASADRR